MGALEAARRFEPDPPAVTTQSTQTAVRSVRVKKLTRAA
jgi:hypothetical protein